jgi:transposase
MAPPVPIIGIDPHKRSHTAVVLDDCEEVIAHLRIDAGHCQADQLLAWAPPDPARVWAIENANGLGYLLAQQLIARGETVVDVPATMAARARKLSGKSGTKTDAHDARSVAIAAAHHRSLRQIIPEDLTTVIGLLLDRRWQLVSQRQRTICQLHATLTDLTPAGAKTHLTCDKTVALLRRIRPVTAVEASRKQVAQELLEDWRWLNRRIPPAEDRLFRAVAAHGTTLTSIYGVGDVGAATIISIVGDVTRYPTAGHFAAFCGTAPLQASSGDVIRHRLSRRGNRQLNKVLHVAARCQVRNGAPGRAYFLRKIEEGNGHLEALRKLKRQLATVVYRRLLADQAVRGGQVGTRPKSA